MTVVAAYTCSLQDKSIVETVSAAGVRILNVFVVASQEVQKTKNEKMGRRQTKQDGDNDAHTDHLQPYV